MSHALLFDVSVGLCNKYGKGQLQLCVTGPASSPAFVNRLGDVTDVRFVRGPKELTRFLFRSIHAAIAAIVSWKSVNAYKHLFFNGVRVSDVRNNPDRSFSSPSTLQYTLAESLRIIRSKLNLDARSPMQVIRAANAKLGLNGKGALSNQLGSILRRLDSCKVS